MIYVKIFPVSFKDPIAINSINLLTNTDLFTQSLKNYKFDLPVARISCSAIEFPNSFEVLHISFPISVTFNSIAAIISNLELLKYIILFINLNICVNHIYH